MLYANIARQQLLALLPRDGEVVEIGVAEGEFSAAILEIAAPRHLHLIDPWTHQDDEAYKADPNNASASQQDARHKAVKVRFARHVVAGRATIHRAFSGEVADTFADGALDWIYIDGLHTYEGVKADLENYHLKVKDDGFILGHDYTNNPMARQMNFGVVEAVNEFVAQRGYAFLILTGGGFPTYVLARDAESDTARALAAKLIHGVDGVVEIRDPTAHEFIHKVVAFGPNDIRLLPSF